MAAACTVRPTHPAEPAAAPDPTGGPSRHGPRGPTAPPRLTPCQGWQLFDSPVGPVGLAWTAEGLLAGALLPAAGDDHSATAGTLGSPGAGTAHAGTARHMARRFGAHTQALPGGVPAVVQAWAERLRAVQAGHSSDRLLDVPLADASAPAFHRRVWAQARQLAPGQTCSYGDLARALGEPGAARAVGQALGANPFAPIVPCHRVLAARGGAGGFSAPGGTHSKLRLLALEGARFEWLPGQASLF